MFDAFSQLQQKVIMKLDDISDKPDLIVPKNVMLKPFLPQQDILAHKNLRLFITHCGMHGVMEAIFYSVPMVGMPVFIDQVSTLSYLINMGPHLLFYKNLPHLHTKNPALIFFVFNKLGPFLPMNLCQSFCKLIFK